MWSHQHTAPAPSHPRKAPFVLPLPFLRPALPRFGADLRKWGDGSTGSFLSAQELRQAKHMHFLRMQGQHTRRPTVHTPGGRAVVLPPLSNDLLKSFE